LVHSSALEVEAIFHVKCLEFPLDIASQKIVATAGKLIRHCLQNRQGPVVMFLSL
jgi:hypothetical protein